MKIGCSFTYQNDEADWRRYDAGAFDAPPPIPDAQIYRENMHLADLVEPLGFDSMFSVEHHFSPHHMTPDGLQLLTYFAGRTERIEFGTGLIVVPWHHPVRAAEQVLQLDNLLQGRGLTLGLGRGAAPREFEGLGIPLGESRARFEEGVEIFRKTLSERHFDFEGQFHSGRNVIPRPMPFTPNLGDRLYAGCTTDSSIRSSASLGLRPLFVGAVGWEKMAEQIRLFNDIRVEHGYSRSKSVVVQYAYCAPSEEEALEGRKRWLENAVRTANKHYQHNQPDVWRGVKGYEEYVPRAEVASKMKGADVEHYFGNNALCGTPDQIIEGALQLMKDTFVEHLVLQINPGDLPVELAERSMRLIAAEVLPALRPYESPDPDEAETTSTAMSA